jgi:hypothetical protein
MHLLNSSKLPPVPKNQLSPPKVVPTVLGTTTTLGTSATSSRNYYTLLGITSFYWVPPTLLGTTADATIEKANILKV